MGCGDPAISHGADSVWGCGHLSRGRMGVCEAGGVLGWLLQLRDLCLTPPNVLKMRHALYSSLVLGAYQLPVGLCLEVETNVNLRNVGTCVSTLNRVI